MMKPPIPINKEKASCAFTLIEVLIVLLILGILAGTAYFRAGPALSSLRERGNCQKIQQQIHYLQQRAWLRQETLGLFLVNHRLMAQHLDNDHQWHRLYGSAMAVVQLPTHTKVTLNSDTHDALDQPYIVFLADLITSPFQLNIHNTHRACRWQSTADLENPQPIALQEITH